MFNQEIIQRGSVHHAQIARKNAEVEAEEKALLLTPDASLMVFVQSAISFEIGMRYAAEIVTSGLCTPEEITSFFNAKWPKQSGNPKS